MEYLNQHLEERVAQLVHTKIEEIFDKRMMDMIENKLDKLMANKYQESMIDQAIQQRLKTTDIAKPIARF
jgi:hypothetical protein